MGSFGDRMRREREMRGITLDEIAESTKIARRHLESLEKEDFDSLPGGIFNRGFVRSYARYLGIDEDQAVNDYAAAAAEPVEPENTFPIEVSEPDPKLNPRRSTVPLVLALLALVAVLAIFWARNRTSRSENPEPGTTAAASTSNASRPQAPQPSAVPAQKPASPSPTPTSESEKAVAANSSSPSATAVQPSAPADSPAPERLFSVVIRAKEDAWVSLVADGKTVFARVLTAGEQQSVRAGKRIVFTTGNAGGVDVIFNGRTLGAIGNESEVRSLTFTPSGLVQ